MTDVGGESSPGDVAGEAPVPAPSVPTIECRGAVLRPGGGETLREQRGGPESEQEPGPEVVRGLRESPGSVLISLSQLTDLYPTLFIYFFPETNP